MDPAGSDAELPSGHRYRGDRPLLHPNPFVRVIEIASEPTPGGGTRTTAQVDDWFHGFSVTVDRLGDEVVRVAADTHRHPWTTCPGALEAVGLLAGPAADLPARVAAVRRDERCTHVLDLLLLAHRSGRTRRYDVVLEPEAAWVCVDGEERLAWALDDFRIVAPGPFDRLSARRKGWRAALEKVGDPDEREAAEVLRRGLVVGIGYYTLPWEEVEGGSGMLRRPITGSCWAFSHDRVHDSDRVARVPVPRVRAAEIAAREQARIR